MRKLAPLLLLLLLAALLRLALLDSVPPGLTHDEANHGREALGVLDGDLRYYFPYNYGSEPLYSYVAAGVMGLVGGHTFGLRLATAWAGLLAVAATFAAGRWLIGRRPALLGAAVMAVSFWPVAASRQALRAGLLPLIVALAACFLVQMLRAAQRGAPPAWTAVAGLVVAITAAFHNYLAARVWWLIFPAFLLYLALRALLLNRGRTILRRLTPRLLTAFALAAAAVAPMFLYLRRNPEIQPRVSMLDGTLQALRAGELGPILENAWEGVLAFGVPGYGDTFLAYTLPGRPVFDPLTALLFLLGSGAALWRWRRPGYALLLLWLGAGIAPSLITGATANTTRNAAAMPAVYLLAGVGFVTIYDLLLRRRAALRARAPQLAALWIVLLAAITARDYFWEWARLPEVRAAYMHTLVDALPRLDENEPVVMSSPLPGPAHDISVAMTAKGNNELPWRGVDARTALIIPAPGLTTLYVPASTPLHPLFQQWLTPREVVALRPDDLIASYAIYEADGQPPAALAGGQPRVNFNDAVGLLEARWLAAPVPAGGVAELLTRWIVTGPERVGPVVLPALTSDVVLFTHVLDAGGAIVLQRDTLDAPSWSWQAGDVVLQIHQIPVPADFPPGTYETRIGIYDRASGLRLPVWEAGAPTGADSAAAPPLAIEPP